MIGLCCLLFASLWTKKQNKKMSEGPVFSHGKAKGSFKGKKKGSFFFETVNIFGRLSSKIFTH